MAIYLHGGGVSHVAQTDLGLTIAKLGPDL